MKTSFLPSVARWARRGSALLFGAVLSGFLASPCLAQTTSRWAGVEKISDMHYKVWACNPAAKPGIVRLINDKGEIYYEQFSSAVNFGRQFNFNELPNGNYAILVNIGPDKYRFNLKMQSASRRWADVTTPESPAAQRLVTMETVPSARPE